MLKMMKKMSMMRKFCNMMKMLTWTIEMKLIRQDDEYAMIENIILA